MRYAEKLNDVAPPPADSSKLKIIFESFHPTHVLARVIISIPDQTCTISDVSELADALLSLLVGQAFRILANSYS